MASSPKRQRTESPEDENKGGQTDTESSSNLSLDEDNQSGNPGYAKSYSRVSKEDLYMIIALWMEDFVDDPPEGYNKVGAVLVLPNDVIFAADCSRDRVHAVARLLMKHYDKAKGCKMFMSRKPCPICAKLLVQSKVQRVLFLPFEPEYYPSNDNDSMMKQVDSLFTASAIAQTRFVLQVDETVLKDAQLKTPSPSKIKTGKINKETKSLVRMYGFQKNPEWKESIVEKLPWPSFDSDIDGHVQKRFRYAMEWIARVQVLSGSGLNYNFELAKQQEYADYNDIVFDPVLNDSNDPKLKHARKFIAIARFLSERTDDPKAGVGAVIVSPKSEILAFGWNGFPLKALYGEFPRGSSSDQTPDKKGPYIIHAEQNAFLMRNQKNIEEGSILFVAGRPPCDECAPLIEMQGIKTVVVDADAAHDVNALREKENYKLFHEKVKDNTFVCYRTKLPVPVTK
ncbi:cytidine and dCMP deaminase domain-containing 1-like [Paramuricea clavata]|uniref:Cytidine and dCMP deaminase domain-containing protein 1 n=1 Tax=Paramuricea clavata TaxID=317549 RepID=A0A7D9LGA3_PARCT|nr:cytidine and dCMP deaminase domain-containing 1-like [Paramuricea clavata]